MDLASKEGLDTSEVQDPETGINIEPTNEETFNNWDYNHDGVIDKVEVRLEFSVATCYRVLFSKPSKHTNSGNLKGTDTSSNVNCTSFERKLKNVVRRRSAKRGNVHSTYKIS